MVGDDVDTDRIVPSRVMTACPSINQVNLRLQVTLPES